MADEIEIQQRSGHRSNMSESHDDINDSKTSESYDADSKSQKIVLEREIGLLGAIGMVVGTIIGSGIFISPKGVADAAGSEALALLIWAIGGIISMMGSLSTAELGTLIPRSAGEYQYLRIAYTDWVAYLQGWTMGVLIRPSSQAVVAMTCAEYILVPAYRDGCGSPPEFQVKLLASAIILIIVALNCYSVSLTNFVQVCFTFGKVIALIVIVGGGIYMLAIGETENLATGFEGSNKDVGEIAMGFYSAMFAYSGWNNLVYVTEEIKNPQRNIPLTFLISMPLIMFLYVMANVSYFTVMNTEELLASPAVAITWAEAVIPKAYWLIPVSVAMSTFGSCNGGIIITGRLCFVMAREREMPQILSYIHLKNKTPMPAAIFGGIFSVLYVLAGSVVSLIDFLSFIQWLFIALVQITVITFRFTMKDAPRSYKVPLPLPIIVTIFAIALVIVPLVDAPQIEFLWAILIMLSGLIFYIPIVAFDKRPSCMKTVTKFFQMLMEVVPSQGIAADEHDLKRD